MRAGVEWCTPASCGRRALFGGYQINFSGLLRAPARRLNERAAESALARGCKTLGASRRHTKLVDARHTVGATRAARLVCEHAQRHETRARRHGRAVQLQMGHAPHHFVGLRSDDGGATRYLPGLDDDARLRWWLGGAPNRYVAQGQVARRAERAQMQQAREHHIAEQTRQREHEQMVAQIGRTERAPCFRAPPMRLAAQNYAASLLDGMCLQVG